MFFIQPSPIDIERALEAWRWLPISDKNVIRVTSFGDFFLQDENGVWFLDTLEGKCTRICDSEADMDSMLSAEEGQDHYLFAGFVERATREENALEKDSVMNSRSTLSLADPLVTKMSVSADFVVAVNIAGQLHDKVRFMAEGTRITGFTISD
jgi:hypothetical protein